MMQFWPASALLLSLFSLPQVATFSVRAQDAPAKLPQAPPGAKPEIAEEGKKSVDAESELTRALREAGNDRAALVRNLEEYLSRFPDSPRKPAIYRALLESSQQLHDYSRATEYAERLVAMDPDDTQMMLLATTLLDHQGDEKSLIRAVGYISRVIDRIEKSTPEDKSAKISRAEWEQQQRQWRTAVYLIRGRLETEQHKYDDARNDLETSYGAFPNAATALRLGELDELEGNCKAAIPHYEAAFALPDDGPGGRVDRHEVRQKLGNCWRQVHHTEAGLGEELLSEYDRLNSETISSGKGLPGERNRNAHEPAAFVLRKLDGSPFPMDSLRGKIVVLSFWATWCGPCRMMDPMFDDVSEAFADKPDVAFYAVNTDEDETRVPPFVAREKMQTTALFADGLDDFLGVTNIPTVVVLDRGGKIVYRTEGLTPDTFISSLTAAIEQTLRASK